MSSADALRVIGPRLRGERQARGWTLDDLATRAGMSASTLSRLESGKRQASLELLLPLTEQLGIRLDDLLPSPPPDPRVRRPPFRRNGIDILPLTPRQSPIQVYRIRYPAGGHPPAPRIHDGHDWVYVLAGTLHLQLGDRLVQLEPGDAAEFDTRTPHAFYAGKEHPAEAISIFNASGAKAHMSDAVTDD